MDVLDRRRCGVLLHPTSLPGSGDIGRLGSDAYRFIDFLVAGGFSVWQTLPIGPVDQFGSPYSQSSSLAGDIRLIDPDALARSRALPGGMRFAAAQHDPIAAYRSFASTASTDHQANFSRYILQHRRWVFPFAVFELCRYRFGGDPWWTWPEPYRDCVTEALVRLADVNNTHFRGIVFQQYLFDLQWSELKSYANRKGVGLFGDLPFYVDKNSADVWWNKRFFRIDEHGRASAVAGVPPDYFSEDGQLWGNPLYDWDAMRSDGFTWWAQRLRQQLSRFDLLRIDHFRALESYWEVPGDAVTAKQGRWRAGCGRALLSSMRNQLARLPLVAEDLGIITPEVTALRDEFELPGMVVVQFGFDGLPHNPHLPANHRENSVAYTGTHDNDTLVGWYAGLDDATREYVADVLDVTADSLPGRIVDELYGSRARLAMLPMQDLLGLGSEARMNTPGRAEGNWRWRFAWQSVGREVTELARRRASAHSRETAAPYSDS